MKFCEQFLAGDMTEADNLLSKLWPDYEFDCNEGLLVNLFINASFFLELTTDAREKRWFCLLNTPLDFDIGLFDQTLLMGRRARAIFGPRLEYERIAHRFKLIWVTGHLDKITENDPVVLAQWSVIRGLRWDIMLPMDQVIVALVAAVELARRLSEPGVLRLPPPVLND